eukprot:15483346-Alexandrium_andersonii.AAC.1
MGAACVPLRGAAAPLRPWAAARTLVASSPATRLPPSGPCGARRVDGGGAMPAASHSVHALQAFASLVVHLLLRLGSAHKWLALAVAYVGTRAARRGCAATAPPKPALLRSAAPQLRMPRYSLRAHTPPVHTL